MCGHGSECRALRKKAHANPPNSQTRNAGVHTDMGKGQRGMAQDPSGHQCMSSTRLLRRGTAREAAHARLHQAFASVGPASSSPLRTRQNRFQPQTTQSKRSRTSSRIQSCMSQPPATTPEGTASRSGLHIAGRGGGVSVRRHTSCTHSNQPTGPTHSRGKGGARLCVA